ncbi:MAG: hypothetical protein IMZ64_05070 [Bacteroidetes bacterium]|nr:hypothetical protein [Bacteroidota bacterium]
MIDETIEEQIEEVQEEILQEGAETEETQETKEESTPDQKERVKTAEYNFKELRKARDEDRRRADMAERRADEMMQLLKQSQQVDTKEERDLLEEELAKLQSDDLATVGNAEKLYYKHSKPTKKQITEIQNELAQVKAQLEEQRFRAKYPDIDEVLSNENIKMLKEEEPEVADMLSKFETGSKEQITMAYKWIKKIMPKPQDIPEEKIRAQNNITKPGSIHSVNKKSAIGSVHEYEGSLTEADKARYRQEMKDAQKNS